MKKREDINFYLNVWEPDNTEPSLLQKAKDAWVSLQVWGWSFWRELKADIEKAKTDKNISALNWVCFYACVMIGVFIMLAAVLK